MRSKLSIELLRCWTLVTFTYLINNPLKYGIYPDNVKISNTALLAYYRPMHNFFLLFELITCATILILLEQNSSWVSKEKDCQDCNLLLPRPVLALKERNIAMGLFLDLSKYFDCLGPKRWSTDTQESALNFQGVREGVMKNREMF